ncbi:MFS transporter [Microlunatus speluncae]|uniref:MFS transporter n=1 Tax=Microlunatus speluncae TaxID=2594267 RepID=UPI001375D77D|nr:MFS transporter [Microlunatus speluncae]
MTQHPDAPRTGWKRNLRRLWLAQSSSLLGLQVSLIALPLVAIDVLHAGATEVGLLALAAQLPWLILPPIIGALADRSDRKRLLVISHLGRALLWLTIPVGYLLGVLTLQQLFVVLPIVGILGMIFDIAYRSFLPGVVPVSELDAANGRLAATDAVARSAGPAIAGLLVQAVTAPVALLVQAGTALLAALSTQSIRTEDRPPVRERRAVGPASWARDIADGFRCLMRIRPLRWITLAETLYLFFFDLIFAVLIVFLRTTIGLGAGLIGVIFAVGSLGGLVGALVVVRLRRRFGFDRILVLTAILRGVGLLLLPLSLAFDPDVRLVVLIAARALNACAWSGFEVLAQTYQQSVLPDRSRASATAASLWIGRGAEVAGAATAAVLVGVVGLTPLLVAAGLGGTLAGLVTLAVRTVATGPGPERDGH